MSEHRTSNPRYDLTQEEWRRQQEHVHKKLAMCEAERDRFRAVAVAAKALTRSAESLDVTRESVSERLLTELEFALALAGMDMTDEEFRQGLAHETSAGTGGEPGLATQATVKESIQADRCLATGVPRQIDASARDHEMANDQVEPIREYCNHRWAIVDGKPMECLDCDEPAKDVRFAVQPADLNEFWRDIYPNGMTAENVAAELQDFEVLIHNVPKVYCHVTGGKVSKHLTDADVVISLHDEHVTEVAEEAVKDDREERAANETSASPQAPIASLLIVAGGVGNVKLYSPGLPDGTHDLYCEPEANAPYLRDRGPALCPHGFVLAENTCGPCSQGKPNRCINWPCQLPNQHAGPCNSSPEKASDQSSKLEINHDCQ